MIITSLSLHNIRSYENASIEFPLGTVLLSGDVGSGKSSILLGIEFALFGIFRGDLSGAHLLRHGVQEGSVTLSFELSKDSYTITRTLKRDATGVKQGAGSLECNGVSEKFTPVELRSKILSLFGYPDSLVSRGKNTIFRYTVFTPQEMMKAIITDDPDSRVEVLRKIFGIDQYKTANDNVQKLQRELRSESKALQLRLEDLPHKEKAFSELESGVLALHKERELAESVVKKLRLQLDVDQEVLLTLDNEKKKIDALQKEYTTKHMTLSALQGQLRLLEQKPPETIIQTQAPEIFDAELLRKNEEQKDLVVQRLQQAKEKMAVYHSQITQHRVSKEKYSSLQGQCPTCQQNILPEHCTQLLEKETQALGELEEKKIQLENFVKKAETKIDDLRVSVKSLREQKQHYEQQLALFSAEQKRQQERALEEKKRAEQKTLVEEKIEKIHNELASVEFSQEKLNQHNAKYAEQRKKVQSTQDALHQATLTLSQLQQRVEFMTQQKNSLTKEITQLRSIQQRRTRLLEKIRWLENFTQAADHIEKTVFSSVHTEFDGIVQSWFSLLLDDDTLSIRLDASFAPLITQQGYDMESAGLSGGEKTALALSYRLALNQVINEFVSTITTRDLLILDEPTDGFSTHQLDRMREVLAQLNAKQIILVSHEAHMESVVDQVIRISKSSGTSAVV